MTKWSYDEVRAIYAERDKYRELVREFAARAKELGDKGQGSKFVPKRAPTGTNWHAMENDRGEWFVIVNAPARELGGWAIKVVDEHSARLTCDALNYATSTGDTAYTDSKS